MPKPPTGDPRCRRRRARPPAATDPPGRRARWPTRRSIGRAARSSAPARAAGATPRRAGHPAGHAAVHRRALPGAVLADLAAPRPAGGATPRCARCPGSGASSRRPTRSRLPAQDVGLARRASAGCPRGGVRAWLRSWPSSSEDRVVWDLLPNEHAAAMDWTAGAPARRVTVRFLDAEGRTVSHWNKLLKGSLVRWLLTEQPAGPEALGAFRHPLGYRFDRRASSLDGPSRRPSSSAAPRRLSAVSAKPPLLRSPASRSASSPSSWSSRGCGACSTSTYGFEYRPRRGWPAASCRSSSTSSATASP